MTDRPTDPLPWTPRGVSGLDGKRYHRERIDPAPRDMRILALHRDGRSMRQIATALDCSVGTVHNTVQLFENGQLNEDGTRRSGGKNAPPEQSGPLTVQIAIPSALAALVQRRAAARDMTPAKYVAWIVTRYLRAR